MAAGRRPSASERRQGPRARRAASGRTWRRRRGAAPAPKAKRAASKPGRPGSAGHQEAQPRRGPRPPGTRRKPASRSRRRATEASPARPQPASSWFQTRAGPRPTEAGRPAAPAAPVFVVSGKSGARLRAGVELDSSRVADLPSGTCVTVRERATTRDGAERCCVISGDTIGWLSARLLVLADESEAIVRSIFDGVVPRTTEQ